MGLTSAYNFGGDTSQSTADGRLGGFMGAAEKGAGGEEKYLSSSCIPGSVRGIVCLLEHHPPFLVFFYNKGN